MNLFDRLGQALACTHYHVDGRAIPDTSLLPLELYLDDLMALVGHHLVLSQESNPEEWQDFLGLSTREDIELVVLPKVVRALTRIALEERPNVFEPVNALLLFLIRELVRRGNLPVYFPVGKLKSEEPRQLRTDLM